MVEKVAGLYLIVKMKSDQNPKFREIKLDDEDISVMSDHIFAKYVDDDIFIGQWEI